LKTIHYMATQHYTAREQLRKPGRSLSEDPRTSDGRSSAGPSTPNQKPRNSLSSDNDHSLEAVVSSQQTKIRRSKSLTSEPAAANDHTPRINMYKALNGSALLALGSCPF
jgi:hypothetical protein